MDYDHGVSLICPIASQLSAAPMRSYQLGPATSLPWYVGRHVTCQLSVEAADALGHDNSSGHRCALLALANHPKNRADADVKIGRDPAEPQVLGAGRPNCGDLRGIGFLKALPPERSPL